MRQSAWLLLLAINCFGFAWGDEAVNTLKVKDPYLELRTGPGHGYPVFHVIESGESVGILKRKTQWIKVQGQWQAGWVHRSQIRQSLTYQGYQVQLQGSQLLDYQTRRFEFGFAGGQLSGADQAHVPLLGIYGAYYMTPNLSLEASAKQALGDFSDTNMASVSLVHHLFPYKSWTTFMLVGFGRVYTKAHGSLVDSESSEEDSAHAGIGVRYYLASRFFMRIDYRNRVVFTERNNNDEVKEWTIAFGAFL